MTHIGRNSAGFGHQVALKLDAMGCHVIAACYTEEGEGILKRKASSRLCTVRLDVTKTESIKEAFQFVKEKVPEKLGKTASRPSSTRTRDRIAAKQYVCPKQSRHLKQHSSSALILLANLRQSFKEDFQ